MCYRARVTDPLPAPAGPEGDPPPTWVLGAVVGLAALAGLIWFGSWWARGTGPSESSPPRAPLETGSAPPPTFEPFSGVAREEADLSLLGVGDGWMSGEGTPDGTDFLAVLGRHLHETGGHAVHLDNRATPGTNSAQGWRALRDAVADGPDLIVVSLGAEDAANDTLQAEVDAELTPPVTEAGPPYADPDSTSPAFADWVAGDLAAARAKAPSDAWQALILLSEGALADARARATAHLATGPADAVALFVIGLADARLGRWNHASVPLSLLATTERSWFRDVGLALWSVDRGHHAMTRAGLIRALTFAPASPEAHWTALAFAEEDTLQAPPLPPRPTGWGAVASARSGHDPPLDALPDDDARQLAEAVAAHRADASVTVSTRASSLAGDPAVPRWLQVEAMAVAVAALPSGEDGRRAAQHAELLSAFGDAPLALLAELQRDFEHPDRCTTRLETGRRALAAGGSVVEVTARLQDCAAAEELAALAEESVVVEHDGRRRLWADEVRAALSGRGGEDTDRLGQRLDAMLTLARSLDVPFALVSYGLPEPRHGATNELLEAWIARQPEGIAFVDGSGASQLPTRQAHARVGLDLAAALSAAGFPAAP